MSHVAMTLSSQHLLQVRSLMGVRQCSGGQAAAAAAYNSPATPPAPKQGNAIHGVILTHYCPKAFSRIPSTFEI